MSKDLTANFSSSFNSLASEVLASIPAKIVSFNALSSPESNPGHPENSAKLITSISALFKSS